MPLRQLKRIALVGLATVLVGIGLVGIARPAEAKPIFTITTVVKGLSIPWDLTWVGDVMIFDERSGGLWSKQGDGAAQRINVKLPEPLAQGEGGRLGLVADPLGDSNKLFYLCTTTADNGDAVDVRVLRLQLLTNTEARLDDRNGDGGVVVKGLPLSSGRHSGCRLRFGPDGKLYVGTGDAAQNTNPQNKQSLGGKVLRVNPDGSIPTDNPFYASGGNARYVWNYGHRNVQGLALRPGTDELWTAEHGSDRDDEINRVTRGANYGWDPGPGYNENRPMTDLSKFPDAERAVWSSGNPTIATSGISFLNSPAWGHWQGALAVGVLKGEGIKIVFLDPRGRYSSSTMVAGLGKFDRIRTVQTGPDGSLYFTTSNGGKNDVIGKITPTAKPPVVALGSNVSKYAVTAALSGSEAYVVSRTSKGRVVYKRSTDRGKTWSRSWTDTGVRSVSAPGAASSASGRLDLVTRNADNEITHSWFTGGKRRGSTNLGGPYRTATISSLGDGTIDVWGLRTTGGVYRQHNDGSGWSPSWRKLATGGYTSAVGASADPKTDKTTLTVRGRTGTTYELTVSATGEGSAWDLVDGALWSGRAFGDQVAGQPLVSASKGSDGYVRLQRDRLNLALPIRISSDPDVLTRPDGSWLVVGRSTTSDNVLVYDSATRKIIDLGGSVG